MLIQFQLEFNLYVYRDFNGVCRIYMSMSKRLCYRDMTLLRLHKNVKFCKYFEDYILDFDTLDAFDCFVYSDHVVNRVKGESDV